MRKNIIKGKMGEDLAAEFLLKKGFIIIERNWRYSRCGEIDIIAKDKNVLVFIEVKSRTSVNYGHPLEAVNYSKMEKIKTLAGIYIGEQNNNKFSGYRFDAVAVLLGEKSEITHYKDIYQF